MLVVVEFGINVSILEDDCYLKGGWTDKRNRKHGLSMEKYCVVDRKSVV